MRILSKCWCFVEENDLEVTCCFVTTTIVQRTFSHVFKLVQHSFRNRRHVCDYECAYNIQCGAIITISSHILTIDTHSSPMRASYGVSVVSSKSDFCSTIVVDQSPAFITSIYHVMLDNVIKAPDWLCFLTMIYQCAEEAHFLTLSCIKIMFIQSQILLT